MTGHRHIARRAACIAAVALSATLGFATSALAAPSWSVAVKPLNPYGLQHGKNPFIEAEFAGEPQKSESAFQEESGYNAYQITVTNSGSTAVSTAGSVVLEDELPEGLAIEGAAGVDVKGEGWNCTVTGAVNVARNNEERPRHVRCTRATTQLAAEAAYPLLTLLVYVESDVHGPLFDPVTVSGGGASPLTASAIAETTIAPPVPFALRHFGADDLAQEGGRSADNYELLPNTGEHSTQAGEHPVSFSTEVEFDTTTQYEGKLTAAGGANYQYGVGPKELEVELPPGFIGDPQHAAFCKVEQLKQRACPADAAVGYIAFDYGLGGIENGKPSVRANEVALVENMEPPPGHPAAFGVVTTLGATAFFYAKVRTESDYGVTAGLDASPPIRLADVVFCSYGVFTTEASGKLEPSCNSAASGVKPYLRNPTRCAGSEEVVLQTSPWNEPNELLTYREGLGTFTGCGKLGYADDTSRPTVAFTPPGENTQGREAEAVVSPDAPSPVDLNLTLPQSGSALGLATPDLKNLELTLASGLTLNPAAAEGLGVCTDAEFALHVSKPASSECLKAQIGTVEIYTPLLPTETGEEHTAGEPGQFKGQLFVGEPKCGECTAEDAADGRLFRLLLQVQDPKAGLVVKLEGRADVNQETHQLETIFENQPQLPFEEVQVKLKSGPRAPIATPQSCGTVTSTASLTPWSAPEAEAFNVASRTFQVSCSGGGFSPKLDAGTEYPAAGQFSDFDLTLARNDGEGDLSQITVHTPPGLTAKIANVPLCEEPQASEGNCSEASQIGTFTALAGSGSNPLVVPGGKVYLTGPYNGSEAPGQGGCTRYAPGCAPYGLAFVVEAKAGPFDLGRTRTLSGTVPRAKIEIDENTAAVTVKANPLPQTIDGVELRVRKINVDIDRPDFFLNPTDCEPNTITANVSSAAAPAQQAAPTAKFDVGGCRGLAFKPSLSAYTKSNTSKETGAALFVNVTQRPGEANIHKVEVQLPRALPARLTTLHHACTIQQFDKNRWACPKESFVGGGEARTPLLNVPLTGPAVLVSHAGASFPDVVFLLHADGIEIALDGHTQIKDGITYSKFETVPDQPITSFEAKLPIGSHSVLAANGYLCTQTLTMPTTIVSQNGAVITQQTHISTKGCPVTRAEKLPKELAACRARDHDNTLKLLACEAAAIRKDGPTAASAGSARIASGISGAAATAVPAVVAGIGGATATGTAPTAETATATVAGECPDNEATRHELTDGVAYSERLPECRTYELVSPLEKDGRGVAVLEAASPDGNAVGFNSEGAFAEPENYALEGTVTKNPYVATRIEGTGRSPEWQTTADLAPPYDVPYTNLVSPLGSDFSLDLKSAELDCGAPPAGQFECAVGHGGKWTSTPVYWPPGGFTSSGASKEADLGQSANLEKVFITPGVPLLAADHLPRGGIYEISGARTSSPRLRLVNLVGTTNLGLDYLGEPNRTPLLGGYEPGEGAGAVSGSAYHAVSESGETVFFTATPPGGQTGLQEIYVSVKQGQPVDISGPECLVSCPGAKSAVFQGASANGEDVFFTTDESLVPADKDTTGDLYEYEVAAKHLVLLSQGSGQAGTTDGDLAEVQGVVRTSSSGSHVYFVAKGKLTLEHGPLGTEAQTNEDNLYLVEPKATGGPSVRFIATLSAEDGALWGAEGPHCIPSIESCEVSGVRAAQVSGPEAGAEPGENSEGESALVFETHAHLTAEDGNGCGEGAETCTATAVYVYQAHTERYAESLTWISRPSPRVPAYDEGVGASVRSTLGNQGDGAEADYEDQSRAISANGEDVVFESAERLDESVVAGTGEHVYLWHCTSAACTEHEVSLVSPGNASASHAIMSSSGRDIFFQTAAQLVPQDTDELEDVYDARVGGAIEPPSLEPSCYEEACQGSLSSLVQFGVPGSESFTGGLNFPVPAAQPAKATSKASRAAGKKPAPRGVSEVARSVRRRPRRARVG